MRLSQPVTQGGQTFLHRMRMLGQIIHLASFFSAIITLSTFGLLCYRTFSEKDVDQYILAWHVRLIHYFYGPREMLNQYRASYWVETTAPFLKWAHKNLLSHLYISLGVGLIIFVIIFIIWNRQGVQAHKKRTIAGSSIQPQKLVIKMIYKKKKASHLKLMNIPLIKDSETQHILITGTTGSGKTNACKHVLNQLRDEPDHPDQLVIIVDTNGNFVDDYFDPRYDIIMNPFDERFPGWDLWGECQKIYHYDEISASLIPQSGHDPFWSQSSRTLFAEILKISASRHECSLQKILELSNMIPLEELYKLLMHTKAAALIDPQSEKTATSIRMNLASNITCLEHLQGRYANPLSIRKWIQGTSDTEKQETNNKPGNRSGNKPRNRKGWLFLSMTPAQRETLRPLISCWLSIAIKSLMECQPDHQRRVWFVIDELPSLHKLTDLTLCLSEGRKYGACMILGVQNIHQLETLYGPQITKSLIDLCSTKLLFRCASFEVAQKLSSLAGTQELQEVHEGMSYGANDTRDGVSLNLQTKEKLIIPPYELMNIPDLTSFLLLPHGFPITKIEWKITEKLKSKSGPNVTSDDKKAHEKTEPTTENNAA